MGREIIITKDKKIYSEVEWLSKWKKTHSKKVKAIIKKLKESEIDITEENINNEILEPYIHRGMRDYMGTNNADTANVVQIDHHAGWESYIQEPLERIDRTEFQKKVDKIINKLLPKEKRAICMRFGKKGYPVMKLRHLAKEFKMTEGAVHYWILKIIEKMRKIAEKI